jgi:small subunit ribosomal protein S20
VPNNESAKKRVRQTVKRNAVNQWRKRRIKEQVKTFLKAVQDQNVETAEAEFRKTCSILDKVATSSTLHRNTAARRKSRLSRRLVDLKRKTASA